MSFTIWFTGLSGSGKTTLSTRVHEEITKRGLPAELLDGDVIRNNFSQGLTFSKKDRDINVCRLGFISHLLNKHKVVSVVAMIAPYNDARNENRKLLDHYVEVFIKCPIEVLKKRDPKGLYARALAGEIKNFTGISDPYEEPESPEVVIRSDRESIDESLANVIGYLEAKGLLSPVK